MCFSTIVFSFCSFCLHISSLTACHLLNLIACAVATKTTTTTLPDCGLFLCSHFSYCYCAPLRRSLSYPLWTPSLAITGSLCVCLSVCLTPTVIVRLHFSTGSLSLSLAVYLFILAANTFAFRFVPQLPKEREARSSRQLLYVYVHTFIWIMYYTHTYSSIAWMHLKRQMNNSLIKSVRYFEYSFKWI